MFKMSKRVSNWSAMLLVALMATFQLLGQADSSVSPVHGQPAACQQHGTAPVPHPVSYRCCQSGHDSAILQAPFTSQPDAAVLTLHVELFGVLVPSVTHQSLRHLATSSADPPDITPLRV